MSFLYTQTGTVSTNNSTTADILTGQSWTGGWDYVVPYASISTTLSTSQAVTAYAEFSTDGTNPIRSVQISDSNVVLTGKIHNFVSISPYFRLRIVNASGSTSTTDVVTVLSTSAKIAIPTTRLDDTVSFDADSIVVRSMDAIDLVAEGKYQGRTIVNRVGFNTDVDGPEDVWNGGGFYTGFPTTGTAETLTVTSSAGTTDAGLTVKLYGLDFNYNPIDEVVTLNGSGVGVTTLTFWRMSLGIVQTPAAGQVSNVGTLTAQHTTTTANIFMVLPAGTGQSAIAAYTVPDGYTAYVKEFSASLLDAQSNQAIVAGWVREFGKAERILNQTAIGTTFRLQNAIYGGIRFPEKTDMIMRVLSVLNTNASVSGGFDLLLVKNYIDE